MSGLKNSPFGKRVRATQLDDDEWDDDGPRRNRPRVLAHAFPRDPDPDPAARDYGDRFVPTRDGDLRTSYHLIDDAGPS
ncbi:hypothetical protein K488DRAFT_92652, partial [Vararia minispora EC-137]